VLYTLLRTPAAIAGSVLRSRGWLNPAWRPCNIGKLGQDNEDYYYYYYYPEHAGLVHALQLEAGCNRIPRLLICSMMLVYDLPR
jgi:hypothetical protein